MRGVGTTGIAGKVVIVTGGTRGIGEAIVRLFAAEGAYVSVNSRTQADVMRMVREIEGSGGTAWGIAGDVGRQDGVEAVVQGTAERFGTIDVLVHNAGVFPSQPLETMDERDWYHVMDINLTSAFRLTKACLPYMKEKRNGRLLFTSSITGNRTGVRGFTHYGTSKAGLNGFIRSVAVEVAAYGITVNGVEPGMVLTPGAEADSTEDERDKMARFIPLGRWGKPMDVAYAMLYLASDGASYVTGQTIVVDGGALLPENGALVL